MAKSAGKSLEPSTTSNSSLSRTRQGMTKAERSSSASSRPGQRNAPSVDDTKTGETVYYEFDILNPPPLTPEQEKRLEALANLRDEDIDFSDIPPLSDDFFKNAVRNPYYARALKEQLTIRLDADILDWFKSRAKDGKGYQTDINKALRAYVMAHDKKAAKRGE